MDGYDLSALALAWAKRNEGTLKPMFKAHRIPVDQETLVGWFMALGDLDDGELQTTVIRALRETKGFPSPSEIRSHAPSTKALADDDRATLAWAAVKKAMRVHGGYRSIDFSDRLVNAAIRDLGGWEKLCNMTQEQLIWAEKEFVKRYQIIGRTGVGDGSPLTGIEDRGRTAAGYPVGLPEPVDCRMVAHCMAGRLEYTERKSPRLTGAGRTVAKLTAGIGDVPQDKAGEV